MAALSNAFSGKLGNAKAAAVGGTPAQVNEVTRWKINPKIDAPKHCSNLTQGMKVPIVGAFEWSGTIDVMPQAGSPFPFQDGDFVDVQLHVDNTGNNYFSGTVLITGAPLDLRHQRRQGSVDRLQLRRRFGIDAKRQPCPGNPAGQRQRRFIGENLKLAMRIAG